MSRTDLHGDFDTWLRYFRELQDSGHLTEFGRGALMAIEKWGCRSTPAGALDVERLINEVVQDARTRIPKRRERRHEERHGDNGEGWVCNPISDVEFAYIEAMSARLRSPESDRVEAFAEGLARSDGTVTGGDSFTHRLRSPESDRKESNAQD
jgi:hypothetical protein